jgi:hypothetical protein
MRRNIDPVATLPALSRLIPPHQFMPADDLRAEIAATAARLIAEEGCDYAQAKRRAVQELVGDARTAPIPDNAEVEREVRRYLRLFDGEQHPKLLAGLRHAASTLMERFAAFEPHLIGAVLNGTATEHSDIHLHLYVDSAKDVEVFLLDTGIEFDVDEGPADERPRMLERLSFLVPAPPGAGLPRQLNRIAVHLHVYPRDAIRIAPKHRPDVAVEPELHPVEASGRANLAAVRRLIEDRAR